MHDTKPIYYHFLEHNKWKVYIACTEKGLCYVGTEHSSIEDLISCCSKQFPNCEIVKNEEKLTLYKNELIEYFECKRTQFTFSFDISGTAFQMAVWKALQEIPFGQTKCYSDIAFKIGNPKAVRAVGTAIGANPVAIAIPCHRVLGKNGTLTGFSGGLDVKEKLLKLEGITYKP